MLRAGLIAAALACAAPAGAARLADDRGVAVDIPADPRRIVALAPHLAEIVFAAGAGARLVAGVRYTDYPEAAARLPQVGDASRLDLERILALEPDLLLGWSSGNPAHDLQRIERAGLALFVTEPRRLADIARLIRTIGALAGTPDAAEAAAVRFEREVQALASRYGALQPVDVFYEIWHRPLLTVNGAHLISDVIALCGGRNVFARAALLTPSVSMEAVLAARPQMILGGSSAAAPGAFAAQWRGGPVAALNSLPALYVPPDLIQRPTPRILGGARLACEHIDAVRRAGRVR